MPPRQRLQFRIYSRPSWRENDRDLTENDSMPTERDPIDRFFQSTLRLNHLRTLAMLFSLGQVRKVAEAFHVTQSAISKQIADIEGALGEQVVRRQGNGLVITPIGQVLAQRAKLVLHQLERARDEVVAMRGGFGGRVAVGSVSTVNSTLVPQAILAMKQQAPNVVVVVEEDTADRLLNRLLNRDLDIAIVRMWHPIAHEELGQQLLGSEGLVVVVGRDHPLADFTTLDWDETMRFPWVVPRSGSTAGGALEAMLAAQGLRIPVGQVESISLALIASLLSTGQFIGLLPRKLALAWEMERRVSVLPLETKDLLSEVRVFWRDADDNTACALLRDCLVKASQYDLPHE
jgi:DNA-binding transcriptional LysR family regulator